MVIFPTRASGATWVKMTVESLQNMGHPKQFGVRALRLFGSSGPVAKPPAKPGELVLELFIDWTEKPTSLSVI